MTKDGTEMLIYSYFNLTDSEMMKFYEWETSQIQVQKHPNNYYNKYDQFADDTESLRRVLTARSTRPVIEVKISNYAEYFFSYERHDNKLRAIIHTATINAELGIVQILNIKF